MLKPQILEVLDAEAAAVGVNHLTAADVLRNEAEQACAGNEGRPSSYPKKVMNEYYDGPSRNSKETRAVILSEIATQKQKMEERLKNR